MSSYWSNLSTSVVFASTSMYEPQCNAVQLSTATGARCICGKYHIDTEALDVKAVTLGEARQVIASGYRLVHGHELNELRWEKVEETGQRGRRR